MHRLADVLKPLAIAAVAGLLSGCALLGGDSEDPSQDVAAGDDVQLHAPPIQPPVQSPVRAEALAGPTLEPLQDEDIVEDRMRRQSLREQRAEARAKEFVEIGLEDLEGGDIEKAKTAFAQALELDPSNADARRLFQQVGARLGDTSATVGDIARSASAADSVRRTQARMEIDTRLSRGDNALQQGDFDSAIQDYENALLISSWNPYLTDDRGEVSIQKRIDDATAAKDAADQNRLEEVRAIALAEESAREDEERRKTESVIKRFFVQANESFLRERFETAEEYCEQILQLDPANEQAQQLANVARESRHEKTAHETRVAYKENWRAVFDDLRFDNLPPVEPIEFPEEEVWQRIQDRGPLVFALEDETLSAEDRDVLRRLDETFLQVKFTDQDLDSALAYFNTISQIGFVVSREIRDSGEDVTFAQLNTNKVSLRRALDLLRDFSGSYRIDWKVEDGVVKIISAAEAAGGQLLNFYDIRDLTRKVQNFASKDFDLKPSESQNSFDDAPDEEPAPIVVEAERLVDLIVQTIEAATWEDTENNTIQVLGGALVVRQTRRVHEKIDSLLRDLRQNAGTLINVETRFINVKDDFLEDVGVDFRGLDGQNGASGLAAAVPSAPLDEFGSDNPGVGTPSNPAGVGTGNDAGLFYDDGGDGDIRGRLEHLFDLTLGDDEIDAGGGLALEFTYLDDTALEAIMRAVEKTETANIVDASNLTVFNGQRANINTVNNVSYVRDYEVEIAQGAVVAAPVVDVIRDGTILDFRPVVSADRRFITMELRPTVAKLPRPIPEFVTSLGVGNDVILQLPELKMQRLRTTVVIPDGSTLLLGGLTTSVEQDYESTIPWLGDIPIISFFVSRKGTFNSKRKLLILVKAQVIIPEERESNLGRVGVLGR